MKKTSLSSALVALAATVAACSGGSSGPCTEGATRCSGVNLQTCSGGIYVITDDCSESGLVCTTDPVDGSRCAAPPEPECEVGVQGCLVDMKRECGADGWIDVVDCALDGSTCVQLSETASACLAECQEGDQRCVPDNAVETCVQGAWVETDRCAVSDRLCISSSHNVAECRRDCDEDAVRCQGDTVEVCHYVWTVQQQCGADQLCHDDGAGTIACVDTQCDSGDTRCDGALKQRCQDQLWVTDVDCTDELGVDGICRPAESGGLECAARECDGAVQRCTDNAVERCVDGFWATPEACGDKICVADGDAASCEDRECDDGTTRCADEDIETCVDGFWGPATGCGSGNACHVGANDEAACAPLECDAGATRCPTETTLESCVGGFWSVTDTCTDTERCLQPSGGDARCVVPCEPGAERCGESGVEECGEDRLWTEQQSCSDACVTITCGTATQCIEGSGCVDSCASDTECETGDCVGFYGACRPPGKLGVCETCTVDAQCGLFGDKCIDIYAEGEPVESACSTVCSSSADCPRAFYCDDGQCRPHDGVVTYHTCAAIRDLFAAKGCIPGLDQCGLQGVNDGTCNLGTCTIGCSDDTDCPEGTHCNGSTLKFCKLD